MNKKIYMLFFFSGVSALIFEIIWTRLLSLVFGITIYAVTVVLAVYMSGLALGSIFWGKINSKNNKPLLLYSKLEFGIGIFGLLFPIIMNFIKKFYIHFSSFSINNTGNFIFFQIIACTLILIIPTFLMGGTFPVIYKYFEMNKERSNNTAGLLYAFNTIGAVIGTFLAGFVLINNSGVFIANSIAGFINIFIGLYAWYKHDKNETRIINEYKNQAQKFNFWFLLFAISGFCSIAYEIIWTRILVLIINSTVYAFSIILIIFLAGIAIGSAVGTKLVNKFNEAELFIGFSEIFVSLYTLIIILFIHKFSEGFFVLNYEYNFFGTSWKLFTFAQFILIFIILFPISFASGMIFPSIINLIPEKDSLSLSKIYAWNTWGSVAGSILTGFILIQFLSIKTTILMLAAINFLLGIIALLQYQPKVFKLIFLSSAIFLLVLFFAFKKDITFRELITRGKIDIIYHHEDAGGIIEVYEYPETKERILVTDRHQREGGTNPVFLYNQKEQGYLSLLLHPLPKKILGLGLGTGITFSVVENFDIEKAEVAEISEGIIQALKYFTPYNNYIYKSKKIKIYKSDARNFLLLTQENYDIIMSELFVPYQAGVGNLYTFEHFTECKKKLNSGGMMWQWIPIGQISGEDLKVVINTFSKVFPCVSLWLTRQSIGLLGTLEPLKIDYQKLNEKINSDLIKNDLNKIGIKDPYKLLALFQLNGQKLKTIIDTKIINSDNFPYIEFNAPKYFYAYMTAKFFIDNNNKFSPLQEDIFPNIINIPIEKNEEVSSNLKKAVEVKNCLLKAQIYTYTGDEENIKNEYMKVFKLNTENNEAADYLENYYLKKGWQLYKENRINEARQAYKEAQVYNPNSTKAKYYLEALSYAQ